MAEKANLSRFLSAPLSFLPGTAEIYVLFRSPSTITVTAAAIAVVFAPSSFLRCRVQMPPFSFSSLSVLTSCSKRRERKEIATNKHGKRRGGGVKSPAREGDINNQIKSVARGNGKTGMCSGKSGKTTDVCLQGSPSPFRALVNQSRREGERHIRATY